MNVDDRGEQIAWVAGFFEGEGSATLGVTGARTYSRRLSISNTERDVLDRAMRILGAGQVEVVSARSNPAHYKVGLRWATANWVSVERIANEMYPFLGARRREAIHRLFDLPPSRRRSTEDAGNRELIRVTTVKDPRAGTRSPETGEWWAWAAGVFEGEGSAVCRPMSRKRPGQWQRRLQVAMSDRDVLERFRDVVGAGQVRSTKTPEFTHLGARRRPMFIWTCSKWPEIERIARTLLPWLGAKRTGQVGVLLEHPAGPVGRRSPTHCKRGHPLHGPGADLYVYGRERQCRRCHALRYEAVRSRSAPQDLEGHAPVRLKTHCVRGHPLSGVGADVYLWRGLRQCRPCANEARANRRSHGPTRARRPRRADDVHVSSETTWSSKM
jgi:hypothetical protein